MASPKSNNPSKSAKHYRKSASSRAKKAAYDKKFNAKPEQRKKRSELVKERRERGVYGKGGKDMGHQKDGSIRPESVKKNRGKRGEGGRKNK